jgi:hypothetical protein
VGVHGARGGVALVAPHVLQQLLAGDGLPLALDEVAQQLVLARRHVEGLLAPLAAVGLEVQLHVGEAVAREAALAPVRAAEDGPHPGQQLADGEGLGHVVVGAQLEPDHLVDLLPARGEHDDGLVEALAAQGLADLQAAGPGQHDVEDDEVRLVLAGALQPRHAVGGGDDLVALELEVVLEPEHHVRLVFHHQDLCHQRSPRGAWVVWIPRARRFTKVAMMSSSSSRPG